ncbi:class I mannose-6-phosphate isomerase [Hyphobacterium sp. CCMP332]|nr:class I mannose-6-phosphate isomerase [Hyphobacterium sp. CCMP332]
MAKLYPLKFYPQFVEKIWGGRMMQKYLGKPLPENGSFGESWEISEVEGFISVVSNGELKNKTLSECIDIFKEELLGTVVVSKYHYKFPLLIKFLDAQKDLSIQVHPNDKLAVQKGLKNGKNEMWYILNARKNATLYKGFINDTDKQTFLESVEKTSITNLLKTVEVEKDDVLHVPAGIIHNIGKGILLAEIQQNSDATYRIYDFDRKGPDGEKRDLHIEDACEALTFRAVERTKKNIIKEINKEVILVESEHFKTSRFTIKGEQKFSYADKNSFKVLICIEGKGKIKGEFESVDVKIGDTFLIPASLENFVLETDSGVELLLSQIP